MFHVVTLFYAALFTEMVGIYAKHNKIRHIVNIFLGKRQTCMAVSMKAPVFWDIALCSLVEVY
jgi:hypothetical protein